MKKAFTFLFAILLTQTTALGQTGACEPAEAEAFLDVNNVRARILNNGGLFWKGSPHVYEVPKFVGVNAIFAANIWMGGMVNDELRVAGSTYGPWEFWAGPLDESGNPPADCSTYDHIYNIYERDLIEFEAWGIASDDLLQWPWQLGAPVIDGDGNPNNYSLDGGDRPDIMGHQTLWWVMNDRGNVHGEFKTEPVGLEMRVTAFSAASEDEHINNATLYRLNLIYKGDSPIEDAYFALNVDVDLGNFSDDYMGSDSTLYMGYVYNADNDDEGGGGYGEAPPAVGVDLIQGPLVENDGIDNNRDGVIDEQGERLNATTIGFYNGGGGVTGDPVAAEDIYNYMQGRWKDGQRFTWFGNARDFTLAPANFIFPGDPETDEGWTELNPGPPGPLPDPIPPADRRFFISAGPFDMQPGEMQEIVFSVVWARGENNLASVTALKEASMVVQEAYESGFDEMLPAADPLQVIALSAPANESPTQPVDPTLYWQPLDFPATYEVEWSTDDDFFDVQKGAAQNTSSLRIRNLNPNDTYYWRVRAVNASEIGPWSDVWAFNTSETTIGDRIFSIDGFLTVHNAAGPIDPPDMGAFAINGSGFPLLEGSITPLGSYPDPERPTSGIQQSTNNSIWGIHTGGDERRLYNNDAGNSFLERSVRRPNNLGNDTYEWRFTQECLDTMDGDLTEDDCFGWKGFEDGTFLEVPFEIWNVGDVMDDIDDYRMIPIICEELCEAGTTTDVFDIGRDHAISEDINDPYTDWVYWYKPADNGSMPGEQGYRESFSSPGLVGDEVFARTVLVQLDAGGAAPYDVAMPEPGTVFRIVPAVLQPPVLSAPLNGQTQTELSTALYWNALHTTYHLQVDRSPEFLSPLLNFDFLTDPFFTTDVLPAGNTFYWRVRLVDNEKNVLSDWSETWEFTIPTNVGASSGQGFPTEFTLETNYPNPFNGITTIRYALPHTAEVLLEVYDTLGRRITTVQNQTQPAGWHEASINASHLSSGIYFYRLTAGEFSDTRTMMVVR